MLKSYPLCILLVILLVFSLPYQAQAACTPSSNTVCLEKACAALGETAMDGGEKNLIACLKNDAGSLIWKRMTITSSEMSKFQITCNKNNQWMSVYGNTGGCEDDLHVYCKNGVVTQMVNGCHP